MSKLQIEEASSLRIITLGSDRTLGRVIINKGNRLLVSEDLWIGKRHYVVCPVRSGEDIHAVTLSVSPLDKIEDYDANSVPNT